MFGIGHQPHLESNSNFTTLIFAFTVQLRSLFCWRLYLEMFVCRSARGVFSQRLASVLCILYMRMTSLINVQNKVRAEENEILKYQAWDIANKWRNVSSPWASVYYWGHCLFHNKTFSWNPSNSHSYQTDHESGTDRYIRAFFFFYDIRKCYYGRNRISLWKFLHIKDVSWVLGKTQFHWLGSRCSVGRKNGIPRSNQSGRRSDSSKPTKFL